MSAALIYDNVALVTADAANIAQMFGPPQWGVFNTSGQQIVAVDSVVSFNFEGDYNICDYPVEQGSFQSYNKVIQPFTVKITVAVGGNNPINNAISAINSGSVSGAISAVTGVTARSNFLNQIEQLRASEIPVNVQTPEMTYQSLTVSHVDYDRGAAKGATLLSVEIWFEQIITSALSITSNIQQPQSASAVTTGPANATAPTTQQQAVITTQSLN